jgi:hypothetical protein
MTAQDILEQIDNLQMELTLQRLEILVLIARLMEVKKSAE